MTLRTYMRTYTKGFTLIEILIVVAIISIISGVVLVSLGGARNKAADGAVQSALAQFKVEAELYANGNESNYGQVCGEDNFGVFRDSRIPALIEEIKKNAKDQKCIGVSRSSGGAYAYHTLLKGSKGKGYCVDSVGNAGIYKYEGDFKPTSMTCQ